MVIIVKNKVLKDFIYFIISKRIARLINVIHDNRIVTFVINTILEIKMINNDKKIKIGKIGWNPLIPALKLIKFKKSIPKQDLWSNNPM